MLIALQANDRRSVKCSHCVHAGNACFDGSAAAIPYPGKEAGLIVDYVGVFRNLQKALAIYGGATGGTGEQPIQNKAELVEYLNRHVYDAYYGGGASLHL